MIQLKERWRHLRPGIYSLTEESEKIAIECGKAVNIQEPTQDSTVEEIKAYLEAQNVNYKSSDKKADLLNYVD